MSNNNQSTLTLFPELAVQRNEKKRDTTEKLTRLDLDGALKEKIQPFCRLNRRSTVNTTCHEVE